MGSAEFEWGRDKDEGPQHRVTFSRAFAVGKFAVTFDEWDACVAGEGCYGYRPKDDGWGRGRRPVINVSWDDAKAFVYWLSRTTGKLYGLLSEAEHEYVTRAGTTTSFWWGSKISPQQANYDGTWECVGVDGGLPVAARHGLPVVYPWREASALLVDDSVNFNNTTNGQGNTTRLATLTVNPKQFKITVEASPKADGTVSGGGTFAEGSSQTVTATPETGHTFVHWTENGRVVSASESYTFTVNGNVTLVADFR
jgi:formylglycine-generating enzyme required for sulfatase activity